jgi:hypothetical protein
LTEEGSEQKKPEVKTEEVFADAKKEVEEEEEKGTTLEDYLATHKKANFKKEARKPEELKKANIEKGETKVKQSTLNNQLKN